MDSPSESCVLVIPCFREKHRLPDFLPGLLEALAGVPFPVLVQVVDDGSGAEESQFLERYILSQQEDHPRLLPPLLLGWHRGKGCAIRSGWDLHADGHPWLAFADADGATPASEIARVLESTIRRENAPDAIIASRRIGGAGDGSVRRTPLRQWIGSAFAVAVRLRFRLPFRDTQCGFKMLSSRVYRAIAGDLRVDGLGMDIELLALLHHRGYLIQEVPVRWTEKQGSRTLFREYLRLLRVLIRP